MVPKLLVSAPRHPANTETVITFGIATKPKKRNVLKLPVLTPRFGRDRRDRLATPRASSLTTRNGAETTSFCRDHRQHREGGHLCIEIVPKPQRERALVAGQ